MVNINSLIKVIIIPIWFLLGLYSSLLAEPATGEREHDFEQMLKNHLEPYRLPFDAVKRSVDTGDYVILNGEPFFVKSADKSQGGYQDLYEELGKRHHEITKQLQLITPATGVFERFSSLLLLNYTRNAKSTTKEQFTPFVNKVFDTPLRGHENGADLAQKLEELRRMYRNVETTGSYFRNHLWSDLSENSSNLINSAGLNMAIETVNELSSSYIKDMQNKEFCFTISPKGQTYILIVQRPNEAEEFLFRGIKQYGRINPNDFETLSKNGCGEIGKKVIPERKLRNRVRDVVAITLGKAAEITIETAIVLLGQHYSLANTNIDHLGVSGYRDGFRVAPQQNTFLGSVYRGTKEVGSLFGQAVLTSMYIGVKQLLRQKVGDLYRTHFPKYDLKDITPREKPLGVANVGKEFRYIYPNYDNEQCLVNPFENKTCESKAL